MTQRQTHSNFQMLRARIAGMGLGPGALGLGIILFGFLAVGLTYMRLPESVGWHRGLVQDVQARSGTKGQQDIGIFAELDDGRHVWVGNRRFNPHVEVGAELCLLEMRDKLSHRTSFELSTRDHCRDIAPVIQ